jgi:hypothetical protein
MTIGNRHPRQNPREMIFRPQIVRLRIDPMDTTTLQQTSTMMISAAMYLKTFKTLTFSTPM